MNHLDIRFAWLFRLTVLIAASATPMALLITALGITLPMTAWVCAAILSISAILAAAGNAVALEHAIRCLQWPASNKIDGKRSDVN